MNTFQLQCFLVVSETLNFARAAEILNITQPSITHQIKALETELGVRLFNRTTRKVTITPQGEALIADASSMVLIENRVKKRYATGHEGYVEILRLGLQGFSHLSNLPNAISKLRLMHPNLLPEYHVVSGLQFYRLLDEDSIDVALGFNERNQKDIPYKYRELLKSPIMVVTDKTQKMGSSSCTREDIIGKPLIINSPARSTGAVIRLQDKLLEYLNPSQIYFSSSVEVSIAMVKAGYGMSLIPQIQMPNDDEINVHVLEDIKPISYGAYYKTAKDKPLVKDFLECFATVRG